MNNELQLKSAILIANLNNFLMTLSLSGDQLVNAAKLISECGELFRELHPESPKLEDLQAEEIAEVKEV